ncbi:MAG TPA: nucleotidyl transferase AbiEii/AbiGii toxin family protein [Solirubrobacteraceae bacterium]|nr:nucleotidyl transferase AbiEii/AbiGii toxin family protein [Solirubrobacteraceae bacterium]
MPAVLHKWIASYAQETGQLPERITRQVSYMVAAQALERARDEQGAPLFLIKGGVMIELRLGMRARATKDLDAVFRAQFDAWLDQLDDAISGRAVYGSEQLAKFG